MSFISNYSLFEDVNNQETRGKYMNIFSEFIG